MNLNCFFMKNRVRILPLLIVISLFSCSKTNGTFQSPDLGWTMPLIDHWSKEDLRKIYKDIKEGNEILKKTNNDLKLTGKEKVLIVLRKNAITKFQVSITPFKESYKNEWNDKYPYAKKRIYNMFTSTGFKVDTISSKETIDGIDFKIFNLKIFHKNKLVMEQNMYRTYINDYDLIINMTSNKDDYKKQMLDMLRKSKFDKTLEKEKLGTGNY